MDSQPIPCRHVIAVPCPGRGHINPMMNFCRLLTSRSDVDIRITFVVTEEWLGFLGAASEPPPPPGVRLATIPNAIPSEVGRAKDFIGFVEAVYTKMGDPFELFLDRLEPPAQAIVADTYLPWAVEIGCRRGIPVHSLYPMSASFFSVLYHFDRLPVADDGHVAVSGTEDVNQPLAKYIPGHNSLQLADFHLVLASPKLLELALQAFSMVRQAKSILFTSFYELETLVFDALQAHIPCPVYPIGPSIPYMMPEQKKGKNNGSSADYIEWLDSQPESSVLYVSLGSFWSVSGPQMDEIAEGLILSNTHFIWVARSDSSRLQDMVGEMGLVVPWCDQLKVVQHPSIGGFLTHCGWNSILEGVYSGLPMLTFPISWDQPIDSRLVVDEWKVGLSVKGEVGRQGIVGKEEIAEVVKRVMDMDGNESKGMRSRATRLREAARGATEAGGSSFSNLDCFVRDLMKERLPGLV